jgi:DNA-directed RNA polymerase subunit RPC12/RpoP
MEEVFKDINKYEGLYQVSNLGNVLSLAKNDGNGYRDRILEVSETNTGYLRVTLCKNGITERISIHRLVAETFIDNPYNKPHVNHIDNSTSNNVVTNLEWCTHSENMLHAYRQGRLDDTLSKATQAAILPNYRRYAKVWMDKLGDRFLGYYPPTSVNYLSSTKPTAAVKYICSSCHTERIALTSFQELTKHNGKCPNCMYVVTLLDEDIV